MVDKRYEWADGATLEEHSRRKHKILREYVFDYITVRCKLPQQERFRLAIVDGFAGGGRYQCGAAGSPLIFIEELKRAVEAVNTQRAVQGLGTIEVECLLVFNDASRDAIELLKTHVAPMQADIALTCPKLHLRVEYLNEFFEAAYPKIKELLRQGRYRSVIFNLDQCGHSHVERGTILDIMHSWPAAEIFYTFVITSLLAFLQKDQPERLRAQLDHLGIPANDVQALDGLMSRKDWLGTAEKIVFDAFRLCAPYVSPFSINNPGGWRYWLIHFANAHRRRSMPNGRRPCSKAPAIRRSRPPPSVGSPTWRASASGSTGAAIGGITCAHSLSASRSRKPKCALWDRRERCFTRSPPFPAGNRRESAYPARD